MILRNYIYNLIYQLFILIIPLISTPYLVRALGSEGLGLFDYLLSIVTIFITFGLIGFGNYGNREIAYRRNNIEILSRTFNEIMSAQLLLGLVISIIYVIFVFIYGKYMSYLSVFYIFILANVIDTSWYFSGLEKMKIPITKNFISKIILIITIFVFIKRREDLYLYILYYGLSIIIANFQTFYELYKNNVEFHFDFRNLFRHIYQSFRLFTPTITNMVFLYFGKLIIVNNIHDLNVLAYYSVAEKIILIPLTFVSVINTVLFPRIANLHENNGFTIIENYIEKLIKFTIMFSIPMTFGIYIISDYLIPWYLGVEFKMTIEFLKLLSPNIFLLSLVNITSSMYFVATNQIKILTLSNFISAIVYILLNILLFSNVGVYIVPISLVISNILILLIHFNYLFKQVKFSKKFAKFFLRYLSISFVISYISYKLSNTINGYFVKTIFCLLFFSISYFLVLYVIKDENLEQGLNFLRRIIHLGDN